MITELLQIMREFRHWGNGDEQDIRHYSDKIMDWFLKYSGRGGK